MPSLSASPPALPMVRLLLVAVLVAAGASAQDAPDARPSLPLVALAAAGPDAPASPADDAPETTADSTDVLPTVLPSPTVLPAGLASPALPVTRPSDLDALADTTRSPLDTLAMSPWERVWWGRRGVMRQTGLFPTHPDEPLDDLRQVAQVRRRMLRWHQTLGLATVASMGVTVAGGVAAALDAGEGLHEASLPVTIGLYATTATLSLLAPPPPVRLDGRRGVDSITIHRWLAVGHVAGMLLTPLLSEDGRAVHQAMGVATFATFSAAMLTVTLLNR